MSNELPKWWTIQKLLDLAPLVPTGIPKFFGEVEYYSTGSIQGTKRIPEGRFSFSNRPSRANRWVHVGDVLQARMQGTNKALLVNAEIAEKLFSTGFLQLRPDSRICESRYLYHFLSSKQFLDERDSFATGSTQIALTDTGAKQLSIPLPPFPEQRRIVAKLDKLLGKVDACRMRLEKIPVILKRFRQAVLAVACSGRLTADWREQNLAATTDETPEDFPAGWKPACVRDVIENLKYGTAQKCDYERRGVPVLRIPNIVNGTIDHTDLKYAELPAKELENLRLYVGDILLIRSNGSVSLVGKSAIVREQERSFAYAGYLIRIRPIRSVVEPEFLNLVLGSYDIRLQIELEARSTSGVNNINGEEVRDLRFSLPPLIEQHEIVHRVEALFALAYQIEARYMKAKTHTDKLTQSILSKAFRGELVPQDPNNEPASELLKRIKQEKIQRETNKKHITKIRDNS